MNYFLLASLAQGKANQAGPSMEDHAKYFSDTGSNADLETQKKADEIRLKTVDSIQQLLKANPKGARRFELFLRLGETYVERHDYLREVELEDYNKRYENWNSNKKKGNEPRLSNKNSKKEMNKAVDAYRKLIAEFPKHPRSDAIMFELGKTLARIGNDNALMYFKKIIANYPQSPILPDTYLAMGEFYFDKHKMKDALSSYKAVMNYKNSKAYPYAVYKLGWTYYNTKPKSNAEEKENYAKAVTSFKLVIKLSDVQKEKTNVINLKNEALNDLIMVWTETEDVQEAWDYFKNIGEKDAFYTLLTRLGNLYADQGRNKNAINLFERLLKEAPLRSGNPEVHARTVDLYDEEHNRKQVVTNLMEMQKLYAEKGSWQSANQQNQNLLIKTGAMVEKKLHHYGTLYHQRAQKGKFREYYADASRIYSFYLENYSKEKAAYEIRFYLAEIQLEEGQHEFAALNYSIVAKTDSKGKFYQIAALNTVVALNNAINKTKFAKLPEPGQAKEVMEIPKLKSLLVSASDQYTEWFPQSKDAYPMQFSSAKTFFDYGHYDEAIKRFSSIAERLPKTSQGEGSVKMILGYYAQKKDWESLVTWGQKFSQNKIYASSPKTREIIFSNLKAAMFNIAMDYEKIPQYEKAALAFIRFQEMFPSDKNADRSLYNASLNFYKAKQIEKAIEANKTILTKYPKSSLTSDVIASLGESYESLGRYDESAQYYARLAKEYPSDKRSSQALFNAALLNKGLEKYSLAEQNFQNFITKYPSSSMNNEAMEHLAECYAENQQWNESVKTYNKLSQILEKSNLDQSLVAEAHAMQISYQKIAAKDGTKLLNNLRKKLLKKGAPNAYEARSIVAAIEFKNTDAAFKEFMSIPIQGGKGVEGQVRKKQTRLVQLAGTYENILSLGSSEYTVASLYRLGQMHENFAKELFNSTPAQGVSSAEQDAYKTQIEKVAMPLQDQGIKFFEVAYERTKEVETFSPWTVAAYEKMSSLQPDKFSPVDEQSAEASYVSYKLNWNKNVASLTE